MIRVTMKARTFALQGLAAIPDFPEKPAPAPYSTAIRRSVRALPAKVHFCPRHKNFTAKPPEPHFRPGSTLFACPERHPFRIPCHPPDCAFHRRSSSCQRRNSSCQRRNSSWQRRDSSWQQRDSSCQQCDSSWQRRSSSCHAHGKGWQVDVFGDG